MSVQSKIDYLIKIGLGPDPEKLPLYRKVMMQPEAAVKNVVIRKETSEILSGLVHLVLTDDVLYNRVKALLLRTKKKQLPENLTDVALKSLIEKSVEFDVPLNVVVEVYQRGFFEEGRNLDPDQNGFNRVNSFLTGGRALDLDRDILDEYYTLEEATKKKKPRPYNPVLRVVGKLLKTSLVTQRQNMPKDKKLS